MPMAYATTKLTEDKVREIRDLWNWGWRRRELSRDFKVSETTIDDVVTRRTWKNVA